MPVLDGLEDAGRVVGRQEQATSDFIKGFRAEHPSDDAVTEYIYASMLSIAQNVDVQNLKGREVSRNMTSLLAYVQELRAMYEPTADGNAAGDKAMEVLQLLAGDPR